MMKKAISLLIAAVAASCAWASQWQVFPSFVGTKTQNVIDTDDKVYYLVSGCLYCFDKQTLENESLNRGNYLNDVAVKNVYFNPFRSYLMIVYNNSNIDVITSEGEVVNMPYIKEASLTQSKTINDVTFSAEGRVYLATDFGYVVINDKKWEVKESRIFGQKVASVAEMNGYLLLSEGNNLHYGWANQHYETIGSMPLLKANFSNDDGRLRPITNNRLLVLTGWTFIAEMNFNQPEQPSAAIQESQPYYAYDVQATPSGYLINCFDAECYLTLDAAGTHLSKVEGGKQMYSAYKDGDGTLWAVGENGLHKATDETFYKPIALSFETPY